MHSAILNAINGLQCVARSFADRPRGIDPALRRELDTAAGSLELLALLMTAGKRTGNAVEAALEVAQPVIDAVGKLPNSVARLKVIRCHAVLEAALNGPPEAVDLANQRVRTLQRSLASRDPY